MRLDYLRVDNFKNLRNFNIDFDQGSPTTVLVGRNGSGKSNLLEALIIIFRDLDLGEPPSFAYELSYFCRTHHIKIKADPEGLPRDAIRVWVREADHRSNQTSLIPDANEGFEEISYTRFKHDARDKYLPRYVFGYYSGPSNRMEQHFEKHQERFYQSLLKGEEKPLRPLLYARLAHSQFVLLAFFSEHSLDTQRFLEEHLWIQGLDSVLFVMRQPPWKSKEGDSRFWRARGAVRDFLDKLYEYSLVPLRLKQRVPIEFGSSSTLEHLYLYLEDPKALQKLANVYSTRQEFFKALESTYISKLISEVRIRVKIRGAGGSLTFRELSEGEQQLLMVLGLLRFTKEDESLFLLDEPDTHLNPVWSLQYLDFVNNVVGAHQNSHIIMTTHDPLTIAGLEKKQVQLVQRDGKGLVTAVHPSEDPRGMGIAALLTSDVYGLRSQLDLETQKLLDERRELAASQDLTDTQRRRLTELNKTLDGLDFAITVRDPLYQKFVKEMTLRQGRDVAASTILTPEQFRDQRELALKILAELNNDTDTSER